MLVDSQRKRILLEDGTSVVGVDDLALRILKKEPIENIKVLDGFDTDSFKKIFGDDLSISETYTPTVVPPSHGDCPESFDMLMARILESDRFNSCDEYVARVEMELSFFETTKNIEFLLGVSDLIEQFRTSGVVWGVGRGSACASLVLYILHVHDIDPIQYDISFSELSKDGDYA